MFILRERKSVSGGRAEREVRVRIPSRLRAANQLFEIASPKYLGIPR